MGKAISMNLLRHGFKLTVLNRTLSRCDELVKLGASIGETPAPIVFDKDGILEEICSGKGYIDMSTVADTSLKITEAITSKGCHFLEAPVSGSKQPAESGQLVILAAGKKTLYEEALTAFDVMGKKSCFLGQVGNGAKMKLLVNMILGRMVNAFSEGLALTDRSGLYPQTLLDVLVRKHTNSWLKFHPTADFSLSGRTWVEFLIQCLGEKDQIKQAFKKARSIGLGDLDFTAC